MSETATVPTRPGVPAALPDGVRSEPVTLRRVIASEWTKFRTLRSTVAVLAAAIVGILVIALIVAYNTRHLSGNLQPDDLSASATLQGYYLGQLLIGALGVLFVTGEYSTGMIRSTFAAVPKRLPVLWGKLTVFVAITATAMIAACFVAFLSAQALISHYRVGYSLSDPGVLRVVIGTGAYLMLIGTIGAMIGWIVRSTPGALVTYIATILVLPVLFGNVLGHWGKQVAKFLPSNAGGSFVHSIRGLDGPALAPMIGLVVLLLWVAVAIGVVAIQLPRRDT